MSARIVLELQPPQHRKTIVKLSSVPPTPNEGAESGGLPPSGERNARGDRSSIRAGIGACGYHISRLACLPGERPVVTRASSCRPLHRRRIPLPSVKL